MDACGMRLLLKISLCALFLAQSLGAAIDKDKVFILANSDDAASVRIAQEYSNLREIPTANIIALPLGKAATVSREFYNDKIAEPLSKKLFEMGAVAGTENKNPNEGEKRYALTRFDADFLVLCRGVPHRIAATPKRNDRPAENDHAAVDSELALLFNAPYKLAGIQKNPLFFNREDENAYKTNFILRTARLDGITETDALDMVRRGIAAEKKGLMGRAYIDKAQKMALGDDWLEHCAKIAGELGFDTTLDEEKNVLGCFTRLDAVAVYFGWYASRITPNFLSPPVFQVSEGACGWRVASFSADNLGSESYWTAGLIARGMSATVGNVYEPFLPPTHNCDKFFVWLALGNSAGEAAYFSLPSISWQAVFFGDPLYTPFRYTLERQLEDIAKGDYSETHAYAVIRMMNLIEKKRGADDALAFASKYVSKFKRIPLFYKIAQMLDKGGKTAEALDVMRGFFMAPDFKPEEYSLIAEISKFYAARGDADTAIKIGVYLSGAGKDFENFQAEVLPYYANLAKASSRPEDAEKINAVLSPMLAERARLAAEKKAKAEAAAKAKAEAQAK